MELKAHSPDPAHEEDMATLRERRPEVGEAANAALDGELDAERVGDGRRAARDLRAGAASPPGPSRLTRPKITFRLRVSV